MATPNAASSAQPATASIIAPPTSYVAAHAVLFTNELLCDIVCHLPANGIVVNTGVCRTWREALKSRPAVQQAMFLTPAPVRQAVRDPLTLNTCIKIGKAHPSLARVFGNFRLLWPCDTKSLPDYGPTVPAKFPNDNWRDMFLTQPPYRYVFGSVGRGVCDYRHAEFEREEGVRMGEFYDFLKSILPKNQEPSALQI